MYSLRSGKWYLRFVCKNCERTQVLFPDLSNGQSKISGSYIVKCPDCRYEGRYDSENIERYQHRPAIALLA
jgi:RNase P subunit RPR2